jgi:glucose-6-phosphate-specific signal transduction histidine kinase
VINGINAIINQYDLNLETIVQNLIGVGLGIGTIVAKNGIIEIVKRLRNKIPKNKEKEIITDLVDDIEVEPIIKKFGELHDEESELIKEQ